MYGNYHHQGVLYQKENTSSGTTLVREDLEGEKIQLSYKPRGIVRASNINTGQHSKKEFIENEEAVEFFQHLANKYKILPGYFDGVE